MKTFVIAGLLLGAAPVLAQTAVPLTSTVKQTELSQLLSGVNTVSTTGLVGAVAVYGPNAFPVALGKSGKDTQSPFCGAAFTGKGRAVIFGHDGYSMLEHFNKQDTGKLVQNALKWTSAGKPVHIGVFTGDSSATTAAALRQLGLDAAPANINNLTDFTTLLVNGHRLENAHVAPLKAYLENGGGLVAATTGWGWSWDDGSRDLAKDFAGNKLLAPYGLIWTKATVDGTTDKGFTIATPSPYTNAGTALDALEVLFRTGKTDLDAVSQRQATKTISDLVTGVAADDTLILPRLKSLVSGSQGEIIPMASRPVKVEDTSARLILTIQSALSKQLPVDEIKPSPAGAIFPGDVPPNYKPVSKTVSVDTKVPEWHSLGLYAAPGAKVTVTLPAGSEKLGLGVRIGCHKDQLWGVNEPWKRVPDITREFALTKAETTVANPYGGLVYITVPDKKLTGKVDVTVAGAHEAPLFVLGQTDLKEWQTKLRWLPGTWAEIDCGSVIVTVPSRSIRDLEDPNPVANLYHNALDAMADLKGIPQDRKRPERIVCDVQISAGYMHSGYPVMTWLDVEKKSIQIEALFENSWGHWHEFGHNHQISDWTPGGTGEVTNNIFALYVWDTLIKKDMKLAHPALTDASVQKDYTKWVNSGYKWSEGGPFLRLRPYIQLQQAFGWEPFRKVFAQYNNLPDAQRPKTDLERNDQWMVRFSKAVGKDLGPFYEKWHIETSQQARDSIKDLPDWMPIFPDAVKLAAAN